MTAAFDRLTAATQRGDALGMQRAAVEAREGLARFESGLALRRAVREGRAPRDVALAWFRRELGLVPLADAPAPHGLFGLSWFHYVTMFILGAFAVATLAMCVPSAMFAYFISRVLKRSSHASWPAMLQAALVPVSIGLMCASGFVLALTADRSWAAAILTISAAVITFTTNVNPLWVLVIGGCIGFAGVV